MPVRRTLYPGIEPYRSGRLRVSPVHDLYFEESGNPRGKPVVFLHGGPGLGSGPRQRRFFDPEAYRIVLFDHQGFFEGQEPLAHVDRFRRIPAVIVQGRYDLVCPMATAWALHRAWPEADFRVVPDAGHASYEPGITHELVEATDRFRPPG